MLAAALDNKDSLYWEADVEKLLPQNKNATKQKKNPLTTQFRQ